jgi:hypothetical protein
LSRKTTKKSTLGNPIALAALERAALAARKLGRATKTPVYVLRNGKIVDVLKKTR